MCVCVCVCVCVCACACVLIKQCLCDPSCLVLSLSLHCCMQTGYSKYEKAVYASLAGDIRNVSDIR